jgi:hypothetical protein
MKILDYKNYRVARYSSSFSTLLLMLPTLASAITIHPAEVDFGTVEVEAVSSRKLQLTNENRKDSVRIRNVDISDSAFINRVSTCPAVLEPGQRCTWTLQFSPSQQGQRTASIALATSAGPMTAKLTGKGVNSQPAGGGSWTGGG